MSHASNWCSGTDSKTPIQIINRPGLSELKYRIGKYSSFFESMVARLNQACAGDTADCTDEIAAFPLRERFRTRSPSDPSIALLDAWATVADVLTFYQERIANEGYLGTAVQHRSLHEIASLIGYRPRRGLSSSVILAFDVENPPTQSQVIRANETLPKGGVLIPKGTAVESTPAPGTAEEPQTFETSDNFVAFQAWNDIRLRQTQPQCITSLNVHALEKLYLEGTGLGLKVNDYLFITLTDLLHPVGHQIRGIEEDQNSEWTKVSFAENPFSAKTFLAEIERAIRTFPGPRLPQAVDGLTTTFPQYQQTIKTEIDDVLAAADKNTKPLHLSLAKSDEYYSQAEGKLLAHASVTNDLVSMANDFEEMIKDGRNLEHSALIDSYSKSLVQSVQRYLDEDKIVRDLYSNLLTNDRAQFAGRVLVTLHTGYQFASLGMSSDEVVGNVGDEVQLDSTSFVNLPRSLSGPEIELVMVAGGKQSEILNPNVNGWVSVAGQVGTRFKHNGETTQGQIQSFLRKSSSKAKQRARGRLKYLYGTVRRVSGLPANACNWADR